MWLHSNVQKPHNIHFCMVFVVILRVYLAWLYENALAHLPPHIFYYIYFKMYEWLAGRNVDVIVWSLLYDSYIERFMPHICSTFRVIETKTKIFAAQNCSLFSYHNTIISYRSVRQCFGDFVVYYKFVWGVKEWF